MLNIVIKDLLLLIILIWTLDRSDVVERTCNSVWEKIFKAQDKSNPSGNRSLTENEEMHDEVNDRSCSNISIRSRGSNNCANRQNEGGSSNSHVGDTRYSPPSDNYNYLVPEGYIHHSNENTDNYSKDQDVNVTSSERRRSQNAGSSNGRKCDNPYRPHSEELPYEHPEGPPDQHFERTDHHYSENPYGQNSEIANSQNVPYDEINPFNNWHRNYDHIRYAPIDDDDDVSEGSTSEEDNLSNYSFNYSLPRGRRHLYQYKVESRRHGPFRTDDSSAYDDTSDTHSLRGNKYVIPEHDNHHAFGRHDGREDDLAFLDQHYRFPLEKSHCAHGNGEYVVNEKDGKKYESYDLRIKPHSKNTSRVHKRIKRYIKKYDGKVVKQLPFLSTAFFIGGIVFSCLYYVAIPIICSTLSFIFTSYYIKRLKIKRKKQKRIKREYLMNL